MTNILLVIIIAILVIIALTVYQIFLAVREPKTEVKVAPVGITMGTYAPLTTSNNNSPVGISETKTPQLIEFEAEQLLLKQNQSLGR